MFAASKTDSASEGYQISRSLRFNSADSAYLNRTPASISNRRTFTFSTWIKRSGLSADQDMFGIRIDGNNQFRFYFDSSNNLDVYNQVSGSITARLITTQVFRDTSAWYHLVLAIDTTNATAGDRMRLYANGLEITTFLTDIQPTQNSDTYIDTANNHFIGFFGVASGNQYMTEINFIDGQQLTPSSFGETNAQTGVWQPKSYSGSYGTNGFYLNFSDNSNTTAATLGKDNSGNGNNWTPNNFSVTAGVSNDSLVDSPTSYGTDTGVGGEVRGNYATLNSIALLGNCSSTDGNLIGSITVSSGGIAAYSTIGMSSGKWYWEVTPTVSSAYMIGIGKAGISTGTNPFDWQTAFGFGYFSNNGNRYNNSLNTAYGASYTTNDVIGVALDMDAGTLAFYKNGTSQGTAFTGLSGTYYAMLQNPGATGTMAFNFGQRSFASTAPSGFKALCTQNLPTPTIGATTVTQAGKFFNPVLYSGNGTTQSITGVGFQPDWVWIKSRNNGSTNHSLYDVIRGAGKVLFTNGTEPEYTVNDLTSFNADGFSVSTVGATRIETNASGYTYVGWNWKANGAGSTNTAGTITSTVSANTTSKFSVVTYTGTGSAATVGHGLGATPQMIIGRSRTNNGFNWGVWHTSLQSLYGNTAWIRINTTGGYDTTYDVFDPQNNTSSVFGIGSEGTMNQSGSNIVAYCFAEVAGYSSFGYFTGNGSANGEFVFTGMRPAYVMIKVASAATPWLVFDSIRNTYNAADNILYPNTSGAEDKGVGTNPLGVDFLSNGFKIRTTDAWANYNGERIIYAAFATSPFKYSLAR